MPRPKRRTPDDQLAYILDRAEEAKERDGLRDNRFTELEKLRFRQHDLKLPEEVKAQNIEPVRTSFVNRDLRTIVAICTESFPAISRPPSDDSEKAQAASSLIEKCVNAAAQKLDSSGTPHRPYRDATDNAATFGLGVHKLLYLPDTWDWSQFNQLPKESDAAFNSRVDKYRQEAPLPFAWLAPDPRTYHPFAQYGQLLEVLEQSKRRRYDLADRWGSLGVEFDQDRGRLVNRKIRLTDPRAEDALGGQRRDEIDYYEFWEMVTLPDRDSGQTRPQAVVTYVADQTILAQIVTGYNRLPYFPFFGLSTASRAPEYEALSMVDDLAALVPSVDQMLTMRQAWAYLTAFAMGMYKRNAPQGTPANPLQTFEFQPWKIKGMEVGETMEWMQPPPAGKDLTVSLDNMLSLVREYSVVPDILRGQARAGTPAWLGAQLLSSATRGIDPLTDNQAVALTEMWKFFLWLVEKRHKQPLYIEGSEKNELGKTTRKLLRLRPDDINGYYSLSVDIATLSQDRMIQLGQFLAGMQQQGAISMKELRQRGLQIQAPEEMEVDVETERYVNSEWFVRDVQEGYRRRVYGPSGQPGAPSAQVPPEMMAQPSPEQMLAELPGGGQQQIPGAPSVQAPTPGLGISVAPEGQGPMVG